MKITRKWLQDLVIQTGKSPDQVLRDLLSEYRKAECVALVVGVDRRNIYHAMKSYGISLAKGRKKTISDAALDCGMGVVDFLQMMADSGNKLTDIARELGVTHQAVIKAMRKHGITREDVRCVKWGGRKDTMAGHCREYGMSYADVQYARTEMGYSKTDSLDYAALCAESRMRRAAA